MNKKKLFKNIMYIVIAISALFTGITSVVTGKYSPIYVMLTSIYVESCFLEHIDFERGDN